jgi:hypothetical protein
MSAVDDPILAALLAEAEAAEIDLLRISEQQFVATERLAAIHRELTLRKREAERKENGQ